MSVDILETNWKPMPKHGSMLLYVRTKIINTVLGIYNLGSTETIRLIRTGAQDGHLEYSSRHSRQAVLTSAEGGVFWRRWCGAHFSREWGVLAKVVWCSLQPRVGCFGEGGVALT